MENEHADDPSQYGINFSDEATEVNMQLLAKIDSKSITRASSVKGSIYFYIGICGDDGINKEDLINDPTALDVAIKTLEIEIRHENKHHRWDAQLPHALKILEFAAIYLRQRNDASPVNTGINAELRWRDEKDFENIVHLAQDKARVDWRVTRYA
jgi:hypothetical protein